MAGLKKYDAIATAVCVTIGLGAFAAIVLTDGSQDLSWTRLLTAGVVMIAVSAGSGYIVARLGLTDPRSPDQT